jgi:hypothetical protein
MCKVDILITVFSPKQFSGRTAAQAFTILLPVLIFLFPGVESSDFFGPCVPGLILAEHLRAPTVDFSILLSAPIQAPVFMLCTQWCSSSTRISLHRTSSAGQVLLPFGLCLSARKSQTTFPFGPLEAWPRHAPGQSLP